MPLVPYRKRSKLHALELRVLAAGIEAGTRALSPAMVKAIERELGGGDDGAAAPTR